MELKTQYKDDKVEFQIVDGFTVESHAEIELIIKAWQELKKKYQLNLSHEKH